MISGVWWPKSQRPAAFYFFFRLYGLWFVGRRDTQSSEAFVWMAAAVLPTFELPNLQRSPMLTGIRCLMLHIKMGLHSMPNQ